MIVLDASVMVEWIIRKDRLAVFPDIFEVLSHTPVLVPAHWPLEVGNAICPDLREGRLSAIDFHNIIERFDRFDFQIQSSLDLDEIGPLAQFAVTHGLTTYDATYVQLALHREAALVTLDNAMRRAATALNIPLLPALAA